MERFRLKDLTLNMFPVLLVSSLMALALLSGPGVAHEIRPAIADVEVTEDQARIEIELTLEPLIAGLDLSQISDTNDSPLAEQYDTLRELSPEALEARLREVWPEVSQDITLLAGDERVVLSLDAVQAGPLGNVELPRDSSIVLTATLPSDGSDVRFGWDARLGDLVVREMTADPETGYNAYLSAGEMSENLPRGGGARQSWIVAFTDYVVIGFEHIVPKGLDHILFVLGLFFFSLQMRPLLYQVTAFTLAHTVTLALATLQIISLPASIVEPLIALSIVYVAVENVFSRSYNRWRTLVVFGFGLLHGLGFASVLGDIGLSTGRFLTGLIGFNIGVEIGQLAVIAGAYLLVGTWAGSKPWYRSVIAIPASLAIAVVGAWWVIERTLLG